MLFFMCFFKKKKMNIDLLIFIEGVWFLSVNFEVEVFFWCLKIIFVMGIINLKIVDIINCDVMVFIVYDEESFGKVSVME